MADKMISSGIGYAEMEPGKLLTLSPLTFTLLSVESKSDDLRNDQSGIPRKLLITIRWSFDNDGEIDEAGIFRFLIEYHEIEDRGKIIGELKIISQIDSNDKPIEPFSKSIPTSLQEPPSFFLTALDFYIEGLLAGLICRPARGSRRGRVRPGQILPWSSRNSVNFSGEKE